VDREVIPDGWSILPGLIDLHTHGRMGRDPRQLAGAGAAAEERWWNCFSTSAAAAGATSTVISLISSPPRLTEGVLRAAARRPRALPGARVVGVHLEGPYLCPEAAGAHDRAHLRPPDPREARTWLEASEGSLAMLTMAPEIPGALRLAQELAAAGVCVCAGHSLADFQQMRLAAASGFSHVTHLFNAMAPWHHRAPGGATAVLLHPAMTAEIIADGNHVHPAVIDMAARVKGFDRLCLVTDSHPVAGLPEGEQRWDEETVEIREGAVYGRGGRLCGSSLGVGQLLVLAGRRLGWDLARAVQTLSVVPARVLDLPAGLIAPGCWADFTVVDQDWVARLVIVSGRVVWEGGGQPVGARSEQ